MAQETIPYQSTNQKLETILRSAFDVKKGINPKGNTFYGLYKNDELAGIIRVNGSNIEGRITDAHYSGNFNALKPQLEEAFGTLNVVVPQQEKTEPERKYVVPLHELYAAENDTEYQIVDISDKTRRKFEKAHMQQQSTFERKLRSLLGIAIITPLKGTRSAKKRFYAAAVLALIVGYKAAEYIPTHIDVPSFTSSH